MPTRQGSEYLAVVIPAPTQHYAMLQRNLLYTGITHGKAGRPEGGLRHYCVERLRPSRRWSKLREWLMVSTDSQEFAGNSRASYSRLNAARQGTCRGQRSCRRKAIHANSDRCGVATMCARAKRSRGAHCFDGLTGIGCLVWVAKRIEFSLTLTERYRYFDSGSSATV